MSCHRSAAKQGCNRTSPSLLPSYPTVDTHYSSPSQMRTFSRWSCSCLRLCLSCTSWQCCGFGNYGAARWKIPQAIQHIRTLPRWAARSFSVTSFNPLNPLNPHTTNDTIYALSTAAGRAAIAVVRISGPRCLDVGKILSLLGIFFL